jgi:glycosyltransferase involved in cell wall biosynthesis
LFASYFADAFIFGEWYKSRPYRFLFPFKPFRFITYYPDLKYINYSEPSFGGEILKLSYSGKISIEKGFGNFISVINGLAGKNPGLKIKVKIAGWYESDSDRKECEPLLRQKYQNISVSHSGRQEFKEFIKQINDTDIFLDLRDDNPENQRCLPIRLFYYTAMQRPVIFSDLKAIRREVEIGKFGFLVRPDNTSEIIQIITGYLQNPKLYIQHCKNARKLAEENYNWQKISPEFIKFINSFLTY